MYFWHLGTYIPYSGYNMVVENTYYMLTIACILWKIMYSVSCTELVVLYVLHLWLWVLHTIRTSSAYIIHFSSCGIGPQRLEITFASLQAYRLDLLLFSFCLLVPVDDSIIIIVIMVILYHILDFMQVLNRLDDIRKKYNLYWYFPIRYWDTECCNSYSCTQ